MCRQRLSSRLEQLPLSCLTLSTQPSVVGLLFEALNLTLDDFPDEGGSSLRSDELVDALAQAFGKPDNRRFHLERRPSHTAVVTSRRARSIRSNITDIAYLQVSAFRIGLQMDRPQPLIENNRQGFIASRRSLLSGLAAAPVAFSSQAGGQFPLRSDTEERPAKLERTPQNRQLSRARYRNAEGFFHSAGTFGDEPNGDRLYSIGIVIQLGLSAHLLDVGFDDQWCARHIGLHVSRSLTFANETGLGFNPAGFELLTALLSPYGKWRNSPRADVLDFPFKGRELQSLVRLMLDHVRDVTGHPRPRGWRFLSSD